MQENAERSLRDVKAKSRGFIIETFENIKDIKIYGAEQASTEVFGGLQEQWSEDIKQKYVAVNMFKSVPRVLAALGPALVYIFAGIAVIHGNLSIGSVGRTPCAPEFYSGFSGKSEEQSGRIPYLNSCALCLSL